MIHGNGNNPGPWGRNACPTGLPNHIVPDSQQGLADRTEGCVVRCALRGIVGCQERCGVLHPTGERRQGSDFRGYGSPLCRHLPYMHHRDKELNGKGKQANQDANATPHTRLAVQCSCKTCGTSTLTALQDTRSLKVNGKREKARKKGSSQARYLDQTRLAQVVHTPYSTTSWASRWKPRGASCLTLAGQPSISKTRAQARQRK